MRENRTYGSEGGEARAFPTPIKSDAGISAPARAATCNFGRPHPPGSDPDQHAFSLPMQHWSYKSGKESMHERGNGDDR